MRILLFFIALSLGLGATQGKPQRLSDREFLRIVDSVTQIKFEAYPNAFNPSLAEHEGKLFLCFRHLPQEKEDPWISHIYLVRLSENLTPIGAPQLLNTRQEAPYSIMQSEDARLISSDGKLWIVYNDSYREDPSGRRDMYLAEVRVDKPVYTLEKPLKLTHGRDYPTQHCQKNWAPFSYEGKLLFTYTIQPHEIIAFDPESGEAAPLSSTVIPSLQWQFGMLRGGTPAMEVEGKYLSFFHSSLFGASRATGGKAKWHYFLGAYTFSKEAPFQIDAMTPKPLTHGDFYTYSQSPKRVIFPGGFVIKGETILLAYGKDDHEMWIAAIQKNKLLNAMIPVESVAHEN